MTEGAVKTMKMVAFGEMLLRLDTFGFERFVQAEAFRARYTGGEANVAMALAQWGVATRAVSKVPSHEIGQACVNMLNRYGVNTRFIVRGGQRLGVLYVETGASQRPSKILYDREGSAIRDIAPGEFDWPSILEGQDWLHVTGTAPALGPKVRRALEEALQTAKRLGATVSFDSNYRSTLWTLEEAKSVLPGLMQYVDVFVGTSHDAEFLFDIRGSLAESAAAMRERFGFRRVAYTLRQSPNASVNRFAAALFDAEGCATSREYEMQMVDRIGGGDAFTAGLIYGTLSQWDAQRTVEFAAAAGCLKHSIPGDFLIASIDEVMQLVETGEAGRVRR
jgi:2-dehydro-3-deoxygluconokinase